MRKSEEYESEWSVGDLVEYMGHGHQSRCRFGIVLSVKKIVGAHQLEVLFGTRDVFVHSRYVEKR